MLGPIKQNDDGTKLTFIIDSSEGLPLVSAMFFMFGGDVHTEITKSCTVINATTGTCGCTLTSADTAIPGSYGIEVSANYGSSSFTTIDKVRMRILPIIS